MADDDEKQQISIEIRQNGEFGILNFLGWLALAYLLFSVVFNIGFFAVIGFEYLSFVRLQDYFGNAVPAIVAHFASWLSDAWLGVAIALIAMTLMLIVSASRRAISRKSLTSTKSRNSAGLSERDSKGRAFLAEGVGIFVVLSVFFVFRMMGLELVELDPAGQRLLARLALAIFTVALFTGMLLHVSFASANVFFGFLIPTIYSAILMLALISALSSGVQIAAGYWIFPGFERVQFSEGRSASVGSTMIVLTDGVLFMEHGASGLRKPIFLGHNSIELISFSEVPLNPRRDPGHDIAEAPNRKNSNRRYRERFSAVRSAKLGCELIDALPFVEHECPAMPSRAILFDHQSRSIHAIEVGADKAHEVFTLEDFKRPAAEAAETSPSKSAIAAPE